MPHGRRTSNGWNHWLHEITGDALVMYEHISRGIVQLSVELLNETEIKCQNTRCAPWIASLHLEDEHCIHSLSLASGESVARGGDAGVNR